MIESIMSIIASFFSIFGLSAKEIFNKFKNKKFRNISIVSLSVICCILIVYFYMSKQKSIVITKVMLSEDMVIMNINDTHTLTATVLYSDNSASDSVLWSSSNNSIATVDQNGLVTALSDGNTTIIAQASKNNTTEIAECIITIKSPPSGYSISVHQLSIDSYAYIYVKPYDTDITNIQIYGKSPSGEIFAPNKDENDLYYFYTECGTWTIYAYIENDAGTYEACKPEDFVTIEVTNITDMLSDSLSEFDGIFQQLFP